MRTGPSSPFVIPTRRFADSRGWFSETFSPKLMEAAGLDLTFVQDNQSQSVAAGTVRGIHFQAPPNAQAKLVRCLRGAIFDCAVDLRRGSPTYGRWTGAVLSEANGLQLYIPETYGHAFITLVDDTQIAYKVTAPYAPECEQGLAWDDPQIAITWPMLGEVRLSEKDKKLPSLASFASPFVYDGRPMTSLEPA